MSFSRATTQKGHANNNAMHSSRCPTGVTQQTLPVALNPLHIHFFMNATSTPALSLLHVVLSPLHACLASYCMCR
jgi:hypothetical protein